MDGVDGVDVVDVVDSEPPPPSTGSRGGPETLDLARGHEPVEWLAEGPPPVHSVHSVHGVQACGGRRRRRPALYRIHRRRKIS